MSEIKIDMKKAIFWSFKAWQEIKQECLQRCFKKAGFNKDTSVSIELFYL